MTATPPLQAPQSTLLGVRSVVDALVDGVSTPATLQKKLRYSARRVAYAMSAARSLGLVTGDDGDIEPSEQGVLLAKTKRGSEAEAEILSRAVESSSVLAKFAPGLMGNDPPTLYEIVRRVRSAGLSDSTAKHRARMLLKWRTELANRRMEFSTSRRSVRKRDGMPVTLEVRNFAQIKNAKIEFGDLTVLVGPQATGKSLVLQWFKAAIDIAEIYPALKEAGQDVKGHHNLLDLIFGEGMSSAWRNDSAILLDSKLVAPSAWTKGLKRKPGRVFYIPAHRAILLSEGWPAPFIKLGADTPVVARLFSQNLYQRFSGRQAASLFPVSRILKEQYRLKIDEAIFHGGKVELEKSGLRYRLTLSYDKANLPIMAWTAGQREFTPLLLGLYHVLPPRKVKRVKEVEWIVIEEPEMGLHPEAITVFMLLVLDLLWRGYRVVISTHSPLILDVVWAIRQMSSNNARWLLLSEAFGVSDPRSVQAVMTHALQCDYRVFFMHHQDGWVNSHDISNLDPSSPDRAEAEWGGLSGFSSRFGEAVRKSVIEAELTD